MCSRSSISQAAGSNRSPPGISSDSQNRIFTKSLNYSNNNTCEDESHSLVGERKSNLKEQFLQVKPGTSLATCFLLINFIILQNAAPCQSFDYPEQFNNRDLNRYDYPLYFSILNTANYHNYLRQFYNEPSMFMPMSPTFTSLSGDKASHPTSRTSNSWTSMFSGGSAEFDDEEQEDTLDYHVRKILVPRISGTKGNIEVRNYIVGELEKIDYHVELDKFTDSTPIGDINFANIMAYSDPAACRQLVLACHFDSKLQEGFLGATDSAVPCAMLLELAKTFKSSFRKTAEGKSDLGLLFIFFDGEEAFKEWSDTDSLYGSRHLAEKWEKQVVSSGNCHGKSELSRIEIFVLLDLIGSSDTSFAMYNKQLKDHYINMQRYEHSYLLNQGLSQVQAQSKSSFKSKFVPLGFMQDDHVPFYKRGVPILSLLAHPFPKVWHTNDDNYSAIDYAVTRRILHVLEEFVKNYPHLVASS